MDKHLLYFTLKIRINKKKMREEKRKKNPDKLFIFKLLIICIKINAVKIATIQNRLLTMKYDNLS